MRYKLIQIETFLTVMELGTLTAAAARLGVTKSVVSKRITDLEDALGTKLFSRGRDTPLREAERLAESMRPAMMRLNAVLQSAATKKTRPLLHSGVLRISAPVSLASTSLDMWSATFAELHPDLELTIDYDERHRNSLNDGFDVAILIGEYFDRTTIRRTIWQDRMVACASTSYLEKRGVPHHPLELSEHSCIGYRHMANAQFWRFTRD